MLSRNLKVRKYILKDLGETTYHSLCSKLTLMITNANKFALLWGEAQLCLPYVCL